MATVVTISSPPANPPNPTLHSEFTVTGTITPASAQFVGVYVTNDNSHHTDLVFATANAQGNWSAAFTVNPSYYSAGNTLLVAYPRDSEVDLGVTITA